MLKIHLLLFAQGSFLEEFEGSSVLLLEIKPNLQHLSQMSFPLHYLTDTSARFF